MRSGVPPALTGATANADNQLTAFGGTTLAYDLNGNLMTATDAVGTATYTWNVRNQVVGVTGTNRPADGRTGWELWGGLGGRGPFGVAPEAGEFTLLLFDAMFQSFDFFLQPADGRGLIRLLRHSDRLRGSGRHLVGWGGGD